jgi:hypothetical protein
MSEELRRQALEALARLPNRRPDRMWGGQGSQVDGDCSICGKSLKREDIVLELEYALPADQVRSITYSVHLQCFSAWESERERVNALQGIAASGDRGNTQDVSEAHDHGTP